MSDVALVIVGLIALSTIGALVWAIYRGDARGDQLTEERAKHSATRLDLERSKFELDAKTQALAHAERTIEILAAESDDETNRDLPPGDVRSRVVRAAIKAKAAAARRGSEVPAGASETVPAPSAAPTVQPAEVQPAGFLDPKESLL